MSTPERKRQGPITLLMTSRRWRWAASVAALPALYVASVPPVIHFASNGPWALKYAAPYFWMIVNLPSPLCDLLGEYFFLVAGPL